MRDASSNTESGGETVFPHAERKVAGPGWSDCALNGLSFKPVRGDAVLFYSLHPDGREDPNSLHGGCPVIRGEKFVATKWIHGAAPPFCVRCRERQGGQRCC